MLYEDAHSMFAYLCDRSDAELENILKLRESTSDMEKPTQEAFALAEKILRMRSEVRQLRAQYPKEVLQTLPGEELARLLAYGLDHQTRVVYTPILLDIVDILHQREAEEG